MSNEPAATTPEQYAFLSVSSKDGLTSFARDLLPFFRLLSTGGTYRHLKAAGLPVTSVQELRNRSHQTRLRHAGAEMPESERLTDEQIARAAEVTSVSEFLGHRVASLWGEVHGGILATLEMADELERLAMARIELVCVDFYPLHQAIADGQSFEQILENMDIGGPTALKSAAKGERIVVCDPPDRRAVVDWLKNGQPEKTEFVRYLGAKALMMTIYYYAPLVELMSNDKYKVVTLKRAAVLSKAENGWMGEATLYRPFKGPDVPLALWNFKLVEGTTPGHNNVADADSGLLALTRIAAAFELNEGKVPYIALGLKHGNCCGAAISFTSASKALQKMIEGNPRALFGGTVVTNFALNENRAMLLLDHKTESKRVVDTIWVPEISDGARERLQRKEGRCRIMVNPALEDAGLGSIDHEPRLRRVYAGGQIVQSNYDRVLYLEDERLKSTHQLNDDQKRDILLGWAVVGATISNTIGLFRDCMLIGLGLGQNDRVTACKHAVRGAEEFEHQTAGAVAVSDSFFPFTDGPYALILAGVATIFSTSGSRNDYLVKDLCDKNNVALVWGPDADFRMFARH